MNWDSMIVGIFLSLITYRLGVWINRKTRLALANPLILSIAFCVIIMKLIGIGYQSFMNGGQVISMLIFPATVAVGLSIYRKLDILKRYAFPIIGGSIAASLCSMGSVLVLSNLFGIEWPITVSILPKSITTAIAIDVSRQLNGIQSITIMSVVMTGLLGPLLCPLMIKALKLNNPIAIGVAMGTTSHAAGTAKAMEMGEIEGAVSGVCIGTAGIITTMIVAILV